jgi:hypothetical protein
MPQIPDGNDNRLGMNVRHFGILGKITNVPDPGAILAEGRVHL